MNVLTEELGMGPAELRRCVQELVRLYGASGVRIPHGGGLSRLMDRASRLSVAWERGDPSVDHREVMVTGSYMSRIAATCLDVSADLEPHALRKLAAGDLSPFSTKPSQAKDVLWELELGAMLRSRGFSISFPEPDLQVDFSGCSLGLACKKIYSEKNVAKTVSKGVAQVAGAGLPGMIALNIDDLLPVGAVAVARDLQNYFGFVQNLCVEFSIRHEATLRRYLAPGRVIAVLISCDCFGRVDDRIVSTRQVFIWSYPGVGSDVESLVERFREQLSHGDGT